MSEFSLVIGTKNASSWSLRPWLVLKHLGVDFEEILIRLRQDDSKARMLEHNPAGKVPALLHGQRTLWDSLAICDYLADIYPDQKLWPQDLDARACARSISAEMHSGFVELRTKMPMVCHGSFEISEPTEALAQDIERIKAIWTEARTKFGQNGPFLFGHFTIADAMFAPVVFRFRAFNVPLGGVVKDYSDHMLSHPAMIQWVADSDPNDILM